MEFCLNSASNWVELRRSGNSLEFFIKWNYPLMMELLGWNCPGKGRSPNCEHGQQLKNKAGKRVEQPELQNKHLAFPALGSSPVRGARAWNGRALAKQDWVPRWEARTIILLWENSNSKLYNTVESLPTDWSTGVLKDVLEPKIMWHCTLTLSRGNVG